ncbi:uncharacterized protein FIBRA_01263 [Fibroporia radiculosa]|uniref:Leucine carboxyl methyltransferase 1 n=1 Tax=Fibroporia radiculosa TaxID=599839 RepID=J4G0W2_9APHY|nr:uncharacterized protein FIBRA_01263 [Fibroporia radiculosa]CCL99248.1 predicted protein [Fibroporia radiculosa]
MLPPHREQTPPDADAAIRQTDSDAALARLSAVQKRYLDDPFIRHLIPRAHLQPPRPPLINIGTYVRSEGIDALVDRWLALAEQESSQCQIVSLGAGSDTRFWRLATDPRKGCLRAYCELDFPAVTTKKAMAIRKSKELSAVLGSPDSVSLSHGGTALHAPTYHLLPADLRQPPADVLAPLASFLSPAVPTLLIFECVLVYMTPAASAALIQWFVDFFSPSPHAPSGTPCVLGAVVYEMFGLEDAFGRVMRANLQARNVTLVGAEPYPTRASLPTRFLQHGFTRAHALTLREIRRAYVAPQEQERIAALEMLDEIEELELVLDHYAITWGVKLACNPRELKAPWIDWGLAPVA